MTILSVGTGQAYSTIAAAIAASQDGDTVQVQAGTYVNDFATINTRILIQSVGGMANLVATTPPPDGKAYFTTNTDVSLDHLAFSGVRVADQNGSGIRYQGSNLTVTNCYFHDNQEGILGNPGVAGTGTIVIKNSEFARNGAGDGYSHNLYIGHVAKLIIDNSYFHDAVVGHEIKSRAEATTITNSRIQNGPNGTASYGIDLPNGGVGVIQNNIIHKGPNAQNSAIIAYGEEGGPRTNSSLTVTGNTILNDLNSASAAAVWNAAGVRATVTGNAIYGLQAGQIVRGAAATPGNTILSAEPALVTTSPWAGASSIVPIMPATPFPLGAYLGNPDNSSVANEVTYEAKYSAFIRNMGAAPQFLTTFVDQRQAVAQWAGNSQFFADSAAASADARNQTPVIALPLNSTAAGSGTPDQQFKAFASGQYDSVIQGVVEAWAQAGFSNLVVRPGWEMNLEGPNYAGDSAGSQADWVSAFQHVYTVLHQAAATAGVGLQVVWNPGVTNYSNAGATANLYPGDNYVDVIGADAYSDIYPYSDGGATPTYHDWNTGKEDTSVAQFIADPVNRAHYWSYPAATAYSNDGSDGHSQSFASLVGFAQAHGKAFAVPETGAGNSDASTDVADDAAYPQWLAQQLATAQTAGVKISFVSLWDSDGGGNYEFSQASDGKPAEAAAWAKYFGAQPSAAATLVPPSTPTSTPRPVLTPTPVPIPKPTMPAALTLGSGPNTLALQVSEDAWQGDAQFTISIDGRQIGGTQTATAIHGAGQTQVVNVLGSFSSGNHVATINFLNDAYGGTSAMDRNLYVASAAIDGAGVSDAGLSLYSDGPQSFSFNGAASTLPAPASTDTLDLHVSEDAWQGDAQYTIQVDGNQVGGVRTAIALHGQGATQDVSIGGAWGAGLHTIGISFINDAYGGTPTTDRNLYVDAVTYNGRAASGAPAALFSNGTANFGVTGPVAVTQLVLHLAEDAWQGDAQYAVAIDGAMLVQNGKTTALNGLGQSQAVSLQAFLSAGTHDVAVSFLNDAYGGTPSTDRNLYVKGIDVGGVPAVGANAELYSTGTTHFQIVVHSF